MKRRQQVRRGLLLVAMLIFPLIYYYLSPYLIVEASARGIVNGSFIVFALLLVSGLIVGRGWCGWVCPGRGFAGSVSCGAEQTGAHRAARLDQMGHLGSVDWRHCCVGVCCRRLSCHRPALPKRLLDFYRRTRGVYRLLRSGGDDCAAVPGLWPPCVLSLWLLDGALSDHRAAGAQPAQTAGAALAGQTSRVCRL
ncbi:MAG: 4Fe-4S binding protein [Anaerolineales bacterium]|nr:4Fe-4S binding protein [Anaerolineales bacterium]